MNNKIKRVLVFARCTVHHPMHGGMETATARVVEGLLERGWEVGLVTTEGADTQALQKSVSRLWVISGSRPGRYSLRWWFGTRNAERWSSWHPRCVLSVSVAGAVAARHLKELPSLSVSHGTALGDFRSRASSVQRAVGFRQRAGEFARLAVQVPRIARDRWCYQQFDRIFAVSDGVRTQLKALQGGSSSAIEVVPNGLDPNVGRFDPVSRVAFRRRIGVSDQETLLLYLGRVDVEKGIIETLQSLLHLPDSHRLLVVGDGPAKNQAQRLAEENVISDRVMFMGRVKDDEVPTILSSADVLVLATHRVEGLPMVVLEAMRSGLPIIATNRANVPRSTALFQEVSSDPESIADGIRATALRRDRASSLPKEYLMPNIMKRFEAAFAC